MKRYDFPEMISCTRVKIVSIDWTGPMHSLVNNCSAMLRNSKTKACICTASVIWANRLQLRQCGSHYSAKSLPFSLENNHISVPCTALAVYYKLFSFQKNNKSGDCVYAKKESMAVLKWFTFNWILGLICFIGTVWTQAFSEKSSSLLQLHLSCGIS